MLYCIKPRFQRMDCRTDVFAGVFCALACSLAFPLPAFAYVDPSVMTYTIQAVAGVAVALSAAAGVLFRRARRKVFRVLHIDEESRKAPDPLVVELDSQADTYQRDIADARNAARQLSANARADGSRSTTWSHRFLSEALLPTILFVITVGIVQPSQLFLGNIDEFLVPYSEIIPIIVIASVAMFVVLFAIAALFRKWLKIVAAVIFGIAIAAYIQGNFLNGNLPQLDGRAVNWGLFTTDLAISTIVWIICIAVPVIIAVNNEGLMRTIGNIGSLSISIVQVAIVVALLTSTGLPVSSNYVTTKKNEFTVSQNKNTIVFVLDTLDATWFEDYIQRHPESSERLKDFTYFDDAVSEGAPTILGMPTMLTGVAYNCDRPIDQYQKEAYAASDLFRDLKNSGYVSRLYTPFTYLEGIDPETVDNLEPTEMHSIVSRKSFGLLLYRLVGVYVAPQALKQFFWFDGDVFSKLVAAKTADDFGNDYKMDDPQFYADFKTTGLTTESTKGDFILYHLFGAHGYYTMNENAERIPEERTDQARLNQIDGSFKIVFEYIDQLKLLDVYDESTIVITADHGGVDLYQNPTVLVKRSGTKDQLDFNSAPVTFTNLHATFAASLLDDAASYGDTLFEVPLDASMVRYHSADTVLVSPFFPDNEAAQLLRYVQAEIPGKARETESFTILTTPDAEQLGVELRQN